MALTKQQLLALNNSSFPNNNAGYITPELLRTYNSSSIGAFVDEIDYTIDSASVDLRLDNLENFSSSLVTNFATVAYVNGVSASLTSTASFNAYTQSTNNTINGLATTASVNQLTASIDSVSSSVGLLQTFSGSQYKADSASFSSRIISAENTGYVTTASFNSYTQSTDTKINSLNTISASYLSFTQSYYSDSSSFSSRIEAIDDDNVTTASFNAFTQSYYSDSASFSVRIEAIDDDNVTTASFNAYTTSTDSRLNSIEAKTGSYATTGSNIFNGNQTINGNVSASSFVSASKFIGDGSQLTGVTASVSIAILDEGIYQGNATSLNFTGSGLTASVVAGVATIIAQVDQSTLNQYTLTSSFNSFTQSYYVDSASFDSRLDAVDVSGYVSTGSFNAYTASQDFKNTTFATTASLSDLSASIYSTDATQSSLINGKLDTSSFNTFSTSVDSRLDGLELSGSGFATTASVNALSASIYQTDSTQSNDITNNSSSFATSISASNFNITNNSASVAVTINNLSSSIFQTDATQSNNINSLTSKTGSYATTGSNTFIGNQTINGDISASGNISASSLYATNATIVNLTTIYETSSVIYSSGSNQLGDELSDIQILSGSTFIVGSGSINGNRILTTLDSASLVVSSSLYSVTSSYAVFAQTASEARNVVVVARNGNQSTLGAGTVVRITSAVGDNPIFNTSSFSSETLSSNTLGILRTSIASGADGEVVVNGIVLGVNTDPSNGYVAGDVIYLSSSGQFTRTQPQAPNQTVTLGEVLRAQQNNGSIYVNISNGWELNELHNVQINTPLTNDILAYESSSYGLWKNKSFSSLGLATTSSVNDLSASLYFTDTTQSNNIASNSSSIGLLQTFSGSQYKNDSSSFDSRILAITGSSINTASFATTGSNSFVGNQRITGSLILSSSATVELQVMGAVEITGSVATQPIAVTITSNTASIDFSKGSIYTLTLVSSSVATYVTASNLIPGQTANLVVTQASALSGSLVWASAFKFPSGSSYTGSAVVNAVDLVSFITVNNSTIYSVGAKNLI